MAMTWKPEYTITDKLLFTMREIGEVIGEVNSYQLSGKAFARLELNCINRVYVCNIHNMSDLKIVNGFDWDQGNSRNNEKHSVCMAVAEQVFFNIPLLLLEDKRHNLDENRFHVLGRTDEHRLLHITFTLRYSGEKIRVISARSMHKKEREIYEKQT